MSPIRDQEQGYRRGLVLGLTMAEIAILVIFVLLLVLGALLARQAQEAEDLRARISELVAANQELDRISKAVGRNPQEILKELAQSQEARRRLAVAEAEADRLKKLEDELEALRPKDRSRQPLPEVFRELVLLRDVVAASGVSPTPDTLEQKLADGKAAQEALDATGEKDAKELAQENAQLSRDNANLRSQMANLKRQAEASGKGLDHPPCWATPEGKAEYIFDIAIASNGLIIRDRYLPHRKDDREELPIGPIVFDEQLTAANFLAMTQRLLDWSNDHECRFFVRAFDITGDEEKLSYKRNMRVLEQRFYKYEELEEPFHDRPS